MSDQPTVTFYIKNMVCPRCIAAVRQTLEELGLVVHKVELGKAVVESENSISKQQVGKNLQKKGFELIEGKDQQLIEKIKALLIQFVKKMEEQNEGYKLSNYLTEHLHQNYSSISSSFSESEDITLEKYLIRLKIERVKELLSYDEQTLSEIAFKLNYSSVSHLSNQFKQITGMSPTDYKKARVSLRKPLDKL